MHDEAISIPDPPSRPALQLPDTPPSRCCLAPRRLRVHHVLDDYGARGRITTRRWVECSECGEEQ